MKTYIQFFLLWLTVIVPANGQDWVVPEDRKNRLSTFPFSNETRQTGERQYSINCKSCHGTPGQNNYQNLLPPPGDPATEKIQKNTDGEIFYKVSEGRGQMPSFKNALTSTDIWNIVSFLRSFNSSYKQKVMAVLTSSVYPGAEIKISLAYNKDDTSILLSSRAVKGNTSVPVTGAAVRLFVHRTFGLLPVDEEKVTDSNGLALFRLPSDLRSDTAGNVLISARFSNEEIFGTAGKDTLIKAGEKARYASLVDQRAMWNSVRKAPVWILLTYSISVLIVWGFIVVVLMKLRDIFIIGSSANEILNDDKT
jgi:hypothetical protein